MYTYRRQQLKNAKRKKKEQQKKMAGSILLDFPVHCKA